jgi:hypothetical protein
VRACTATADAATAIGENAVTPTAPHMMRLRMYLRRRTQPETPITPIAAAAISPENRKNSFQSSRSDTWTTTAAMTARTIGVGAVPADPGAAGERNGGQR